MASPNPSALEDSLNPYSPYYVHLSENPSISPISPLFNPTNYNSWCRSMSTALSAKISWSLSMILCHNQRLIMLFILHGNVPTIWWFRGPLLHAATLINIIPTPFLKKESPYQKLYSALYDVNLL